MTAIEKLIELSGLSKRRFTRLFLVGRDERTLRRWLENDARDLPPEIEEWAAKDVVKLERRGHMLHLQIYAPLDPRQDRKAAGADED